MEMGLKDLRVLVTAGASGIGADIARGFLAEGAKVHVCDIDATALKDFAKANPGVSTSQCDVAKRDSVKAMFDDDRVKRVIAAKAESLGRSYEDVESEWLGLASVKEMVNPVNIADMVIYLASSHGRTISGQPISIDADLQGLV